MTLLEATIIFGAALAGGMINSVAGGGTLVTFPTLIWLGMTATNANATSTVALWPGALSSMWGYRQQVQQSEARYFVLVIPSLIGGLIGAVLLKRTPPPIFAALVPFLILFATLLFMVQEPIQRYFRKEASNPASASLRWMISAALFQFLVAVYGGYFGAGIGILMLAALGLLGLTNIHQMNGLKNLFGMTTNVVASVYFVISGLVHWPEAIVMAGGAIIGGYGMAGLAQRLGQRFVRRAVIAIGLAMTISLWLKE